MFYDTIEGQVGVIFVEIFSFGRFWPAETIVLAGRSKLATLNMPYLFQYVIIS